MLRRACQPQKELDLFSRASPARMDNRLVYARHMGRSAAGVLYVIAMAALVVGVDVAFFRGHFWERLTANVGIVLLFAAFYVRFVRHE